MQISHRDGGIALPPEWGLRWWRSSAYRIVPVDAPDSPVSPRDAGDWQWCEGVLWQATPGEAYNPVPQAAEIFDAGLRVVPDDTNSIVAFVRAWGPLGTSVPLEHSVWATRRAFREIRRHFAWLQALRRQQWRSPAVPSLWGDRNGFLNALRTVLPPPEHAKLDTGPLEDWPELVREVALTDLARARRVAPDPYVAAFVKGHLYAGWARTDVRPRDREEAHWRAFGFALAEHLRLVQPTVGWANGGPTAAWEIPRLVDLLWVQLWNLATGGATIRQCRHCHRWFAVDRRGKVYCSRVCTNRASAKASYEARKNTPTRRRRGRR